MKKILFLLMLFSSSYLFGQLDTTNVGTAANAGDGESLRSAFLKVNLAIKQVNTNTTNIGLKLTKTDTTAMLTPYINRADTASMLSDYINKADTAGMLTNYINKADTAAMLDDYINKADTASMLTPYINRADTASMLTNYINKADTAAMLSTYDSRITSVEGDVADALDIDTQVRMLADTLPIAVFGLGSGQTGDTASFNDNALIGAFFNKGSDTLMVTSLKGVLAAGTGTETIAVQISWSDTLKAVVPTNLNAAAYTITSMTVGGEDTSFANSTIPPNKWVWGTISGVSAGNRPSYLSVTLSGYRQNRKY